jgi:hypothetical protein
MKVFKNKIFLTVYIRLYKKRRRQQRWAGNYNDQSISTGQRGNFNCLMAHQVSIQEQTPSFAQLPNMPIDKRETELDSLKTVNGHLIRS